MAKIFEASKNLVEKPGSASEALLKTPKGHEVAGLVDEFRKKAEGISKMLEQKDPQALAEASMEVEKLMKTPEGKKSASLLKELHLKTMMKTVEFFHGHPKVLQGVRKVWDGMPKAVQDAMLASRFFYATQIPGTLLNNLTYVGLLETPEEDRQARMKNDLLMVKAAGAMATVLGYGAVADPAVSLETSMLEAMSENYEKARAHLKELEAQSTAQEAEKAKIKKLKVEDAIESAVHVTAARRKIAGGILNNKAEGRA